MHIACSSFDLCITNLLVHQNDAKFAISVPIILNKSNTYKISQHYRTWKFCETSLYLSISFFYKWFRTKIEYFPNFCGNFTKFLSKFWLLTQYNFQPHPLLTMPNVSLFVLFWYIKVSNRRRALKHYYDI